MVHFAAQLAVVASFATYVAASPVEKSSVVAIPVEKRHKSAQYLANDVVARDQARIARYNERAAIRRGESVVSKRAASGTVTNEDVMQVLNALICLRGLWHIPNVATLPL